ncbi:MAG: GH32 C-terminal domain-containing protein [Spirochaetaceae bacterium]|nr:GH32 C-terminal domain-containing protein [Spirochaetaceae bacterium]
MEPAGDIASLRGRHARVGPTTLPANRDVVLEEVSGTSLEIAAVIDPQDAPTVEIDVLRSPRREEHTRISFYRRRGFRNRERYSGGDRDKNLAATDSLITLDNARSSESPDVLSRAPETAPVYVGPDELLELRIFVDRSVVEVFANGRQCVALRVYPGREDSAGVSLRACGSEAVLRSLDAWQMGSIYE